MSCIHTQCQLCLRRMCNGLRSVKSVGGLSVCDSCVDRAVRFAYEAACRWGGAYDYACGKPKRESVAETA